MREHRLGWLALSRGTLDRKAEHRRDAGWLDRTWNDPRTRVLVIDQGRVLVRVDDTPALALFSPAEVTAGVATEPATPASAPEQPTQPDPERPVALASPGSVPSGTVPSESVPGVAVPSEPVTGGAAPAEGGPERYLLGVDEDGVAYFAVPGPLPAVEGAEPAGLRRVGAMLGDRDSGLLTHTVALLNWHATHTHCPRCGGRTVVASAGHTRVCPADGSEHFPRLDPAVIMLVRDGNDRVLLARHPAWPQHQVSILAGFVEPGESLEQAVAREVLEEVGVVVTDVRYLGSQPWPLPQSLMLGFFCRADGDQELRADEDEITDAAWYSRDELIAAINAQRLRLPGRISIARQLIEHWYGGELPGSWGL